MHLCQAEDINYGTKDGTLLLPIDYGHHFSCYWSGRTGKQESGIKLES
jgi:hypothetical protein